MAFTQSSRVWWDSTKPGASTTKLSDAKTPTTPAASEDSGVEGRLYSRAGTSAEARWVICARSGFAVPYRETVLDPNTGNRVWRRFADKLAPEPDDSPARLFGNELPERLDDQ